MQAFDTMIGACNSTAVSGSPNEYDVERKFREARLYRVAPISTNPIPSYVAEPVLGLPAPSEGGSDKTPWLALGIAKQGWRPYIVHMSKPIVHPDPAGPGQESVWSYPRPAIAEPCSRHIRILHRGVVVADTVASVRTLETSHPPSYYIPRSDILPGALRPSARRSFCEWKGDAVYFDLAADGVTLRDAAWSYPAPSRDFQILRDHVAFYAGAVDECFVDGERVTPQPGDFYGGWITSHVAGPFKGVPGSRFW